VRSVWRSAASDSGIAYRRRLGLASRPSVGVVIQVLVDADVAGVLFTRNPVDGADERVVEASWGLGETVVTGRVVPDRFRISRSGDILERTAGYKDIALRRAVDCATHERRVASKLVERLCLEDAQLGDLCRLAERCEEVLGPSRDIDSIAGGTLHLLQCRPMSSTATPCERRRDERVSLDADEWDEQRTRRLCDVRAALVRNVNVCAVLLDRPTQAAVFVSPRSGFAAPACSRSTSLNCHLSLNYYLSIRACCGKFSSNPAPEPRVESPS
jgi:phosphoenolpyruvate synthase/pyruvate phosphate dikinase